MTQLTATTATPTVPRNGFGITGLVFGLVPSTGFMALIPGMLAMLFGISTSRRMTVIGTVPASAPQRSAYAASSSCSAPSTNSVRASRFGHNHAAMGDAAVLNCSITSEYPLVSIRATVTVTDTADRGQSYMATNSVNGPRVGEINTVSSSLGAG